MDRRSGQIRDEQAVRAKFGVEPSFIPDYLALVGDSADGYPGLPGLGPKTAATLINRYGHLEEFPAGVLGEKRELALLFKRLATLRVDAPLGGVESDVDRLKWSGPTSSFKSIADQLADAGLENRIKELAKEKSGSDG
jgi:5'-3' exonuclease